MIYIVCGFFGAGLGAWRAKKNGGNGADMAQYAAAFCILFMIVGLLATLILDRTVI